MNDKNEMSERLREEARAELIKIVPFPSRETTIADFAAAFAAKAARDRDREIAGELRAVVDSGSTNIVFEQELRAFIAKLEAK